MLFLSFGLQKLSDVIIDKDGYLENDQHRCDLGVSM